MIDKIAVSRDLMATLGQSVESTQTLNPHKSDGKQSVTSVAVKSFHPSTSIANNFSGGCGLVLSGSTDKSAILSYAGTGKVIAKLLSHSKKVTAVAFLQPFGGGLLFSLQFFLVVSKYC
jgi:WD40 repeat protein